MAEAPTTWDADVETTDAPGRGSALGWLTIATLLMTLFYGLLHRSAPIAGWEIAGIVPVLGTTGAWLLSAAQRIRGEGRIEVTDEHLHVGVGVRKRTFAFDDLMWADIHGATVTLHTFDEREVALTLPSGRDARALLARIDMGVEARKLRLPIHGFLGPSLRRLASLIVLAPAVTFALFALISNLQAAAEWHLPAILASPALAYMIGNGLSGLLRPSVIVGLDGISIHRGIRRRFIPLSEIRDVSIDDDGITLMLADEEVDIPASSWNATDKTRIFKRIQAAREAAGQHATELSTDVFARRGRELDAWQESMKALTAGQASFRKRRVDIDDAETVLADPNAPLEHRVGAALAMQATDRDRATERLRIAVDVAADEQTQAVFEAMLAEDEQRALEELDR